MCQNSFVNGPWLWIRLDPKAQATRKSDLLSSFKWNDTKETSEEIENKKKMYYFCCILRNGSCYYCAQVSKVSCTAIIILYEKNFSFFHCVGNYPWIMDWAFKGSFWWSVGFLKKEIFPPVLWHEQHVIVIATIRQPKNTLWNKIKKDSCRVTLTQGESIIERVLWDTFSCLPPFFCSNINVAIEGGRKTSNRDHIYKL
jgi:hypothetical protein